MKEITILLLAMLLAGLALVHFVRPPRPAVCCCKSEGSCKCGPCECGK